MRFYDPEFGTVLVDGVDVRNYSVVQLRDRLGLVMQEPQLFNYNLKENILYGKLKASNQQINEAAHAANCLEFIQGDELSKAFDDDPNALKTHFVEEPYKSQAIAKMGQEKYDSAIKVLDTLIKKAEDQGTFEAISDLVDTRSD